MSKMDYQSILDNIDRRKVERLREFFKQIPFLRSLPRQIINTIHKSLEQKVFQRGNIVCHEGDDSSYIYIILKGEFEVSKVIDVSEHARLTKTKSFAGQLHLQKTKLAKKKAISNSISDNKRNKFG